MDSSLSSNPHSKSKKPLVTLKKQNKDKIVTGSFSLLQVNKSESQLPKLVDLHIPNQNDISMNPALPSNKHKGDSFSTKRTLELSAQLQPFPIIQTHTSKNMNYNRSQKSLFAHKSLRDNYGNFYRNLMKPQGGQVITKLYDTHSTMRKGSIFGMTGVEDPNNVTLDKQGINPYHQLKKAKENFVSVMMNLINSSADQSTDQKPLQETLNSRNNNNSRLNYSMERVNLELSLENMKHTASHKELINEKPEYAYSQFVKNQNQQTQANMSQMSYLAEKLSLKNHLKLFSEEQSMMEEIYKNSEVKEGDKEKQFLHAFKNIEQKLGRKDIKTFESIIKDLIEDKISLDALLDQDELEKLSKSKYYTGFSLSEQVDEAIKQAFEDEYQINARDIQKVRVKRDYCELINKSYIRHLKLYSEDVRKLKQLKEEMPKDKDMIPSVIEQFKRLKVQQRQQVAVQDSTVMAGEEKVRNKAFIYYAALQEMIKQVYVNCKEKGSLFLRLFNKYFEEQEKHWSKIIFDFQEVLKSLKLDREFLIGKYIDKNQKLIDNALIKEDLHSILDNKESSEQNLIEHKRLIKELMGMLNREEDERYLLDVEKRNLEADIRQIMSNWDLVRSNMEFKNRIKAINVDKIREDFMVNEQIRQMKKEDFAILVNLERLRMALSNNGNIKWDLEKIQMECQNKVYREESAVLKAENKKLREHYERLHELLNERSKENFDLTHQLKKFTDKLAIIDRASKDIQTNLSFKNEHFTTTMDQILQNKLNSKLKKVSKLMQKASANVQNLQPMSRQEMMDLIQGAYIKKSQEIGTSKELHFEFDDFVYSIMLQRFGTKKKVDIKGQEFFLALQKYASQDERVDFFKHFVGFEEQNVYSRQVLEFYIKLMKTTNESVQNLMSPPNDLDNLSPCQKVFIEYSSAIEKYQTVFQNASFTLKEELKKHLIFDSELLIDGHSRMEVKLNEKWELYALLTFCKNMLKEQSYTSNIEKLLVEKLQVDVNANVKQSVLLKDFQNLFEGMLGEDDCRIIFDLVPKEEFYNKYFGKLIYTEEDSSNDNYGQKLLMLKGIKQLFREKYQFKITVRKLLDLGIKMSIRFLEEAKVFYWKIFNIFDRDGDGFIEFNEFSKILKRVDPNKANWKIHAIFQKATNSEDPFQGQLNFDEFIKCALNNILMKDMIDWEQVLLEDKEKPQPKNNQQSNKRLMIGSKSGRSISQHYIISHASGSLKSRDSLQTIT